MKACVISGGGSWGAWGGGVLSALNKDYDMVFGVSTGALLATHVALKDFDSLKKIYTTVENKDIFDVNPLNRKGNIRVFNAVYRILKGKVSFGDTNNLKKRIDLFFTPNVYIKAKKKTKYVSVAVQNLSSNPSRVEHKDINSYSFDEFKFWMWASSTPPLLGSIANHRNQQYTDAGTTEILSLKRAIQLGAKEVDVIVHRVKKVDNINNTPIKNIFHNLMRLFRVMRETVEKDDIEGGLALAKQHKCIVNIYWMSNKPDMNSLTFDPKRMTQLWNNGFWEVTENRISKVTYDYTGINP